MNLLDAVRLACAPASRGKGGGARHGHSRQPEPAKSSAFADARAHEDFERGRNSAHVRRVLTQGVSHEAANETRRGSAPGLRRDKAALSADANPAPAGGPEQLTNSVAMAS
jgi:hypothetical protein